MKRSLPRLLGDWCRLRRLALVYFALIFVLMLLVYGLYGYAWGAALYVLLLGMVIGVVIAIIDFVYFAGKHRTLEKLPGRFPTTNLPDPDGLIDADYTAIIEGLEQERRRLEAASDLQRRDAEEYYTLWVHQVKTPISAMKLLIQADPASNPALEQSLFRIEQYAEMALQYQRLSSMQEDLQLAPQPLAGMVKKAVRGCATLFIYKDLPVRLEGIEGSVVTDPKWFVFVLEQLLTNAQKYTEQGEISLYAEGDDLVVADTGIGIPPEDLPRVFERGFTGRVGRSERSSTGLGLYLCREIITRLGFGISIESAPGEGTRVRLHLTQQKLDIE